MVGRAKSAEIMYLMKRPLRGAWSIAMLFLLTWGSDVQAQLTFKGVMFMDYEYQLANPDEEVVGENGFTYRRWRITGNYKIDDTFSGRIRLEGSGSAAPFIKDLFLKWKDAVGEGRDLYIGVSPPPLWQVAEKFWGYRALEKTMLDRIKIASSRDFGVKSLGNITEDGKLRYGVMFANNESVRVENDKYKRVYGQLEYHPNENLAFTVEADYAPGEVDTRTNLHAFGGFQNDTFHGGVEVFQLMISPEDESSDETLSGISLFGSLEVAQNTDAILRADLVSADNGTVSRSTNYYIAGLSREVEKGVKFIPNIVITSIEGLDSAVAGRVTLEVKF